MSNQDLHRNRFILGLQTLLKEIKVKLKDNQTRINNKVVLKIILHDNIHNLYNKTYYY